MGIKYSIRIYKKEKTLTNKMKLAFSLLALAFHADDDVVPDDTWQGAGTSNSAAVGPRSGAGGVQDADRRYDDLTDIAKKHWQKNGLTGKLNRFDDRKYWTYGCHCFLLGDRPMSEMGHGRPVDALDNKCKAYKDCQKCVRAKHGDQCIGEFIRYTWKWSKSQGTFVSANDEGSCNVNSSNVMFNLPKTLLQTEQFSMKTTMLSGPQLVLTTETMNHAHQVGLFQLNINAVVVLMHHGTGLVLNHLNAAVVMLKVMVVLSKVSTTSAEQVFLNSMIEQFLNLRILLIIFFLHLYR